MLKNVSGQTLVLRWDGQETKLLPGQTCRYRDPRVERRMSAKHEAALQYTPEPIAEAKAQSQVVVDELPSQPDQSALPLDVDSTKMPLACSDCVFVATNVSGLASHRRAKHAR